MHGKMGVSDMDGRISSVQGSVIEGGFLIVMVTDFAGTMDRFPLVPLRWLVGLFLDIARGKESGQQVGSKKVCAWF